MLAELLDSGRAWMEGRSRTFVVLMSLVMIAGIWVADLFSSWSLLIFYLLPLMLAACYTGLVPAMCLSLLVTTGRLASDLLYFDGIQTSSHIANFASCTALFFLFVFLESSRERLLRRERLLSGSDPLTGAANSRAFVASAEREISRQRRTGRPLSVAFLDLDDFKGVNDRCGHGAGDGLLCAVTGVLLGMTRREDIVARIGGDEFAIMFPETGSDELHAVLGRIRGELEFVANKGGWLAGFSIGAVTMTWPPGTVYDMLQLADKLMYSSKQEGKNRTCYWEQTSAPLRRGRVA